MIAEGFLALEVGPYDERCANASFYRVQCCIEGATLQKQDELGHRLLGPCLVRCLLDTQS
jgi:hypothetical protein